MDKFYSSQKLYGVSDERIQKRDLHDFINKIQASIRSTLKKEKEQINKKNNNTNDNKEKRKHWTNQK